MIKPLKVLYLENADEALRKPIMSQIVHAFPSEAYCRISLHSSDFGAQRYMTDNPQGLLITNIGENVAERFKTIEVGRSVSPQMPVIIYTGGDVLSIQEKIMNEQWSEVYAIARPTFPSTELVEKIHMILERLAA